MSSPTRLASNTDVTIWPVIGRDPYAGLKYGAPIRLKASFEQGSSRQYRNSQGTLYIPASIYWLELGAFTPNLNDYIALGDHLITPTPQDVTGAETIENIIRQDCSSLGEPDDLMVLT